MQSGICTQVSPTQDFVYDAIYRLVWAKGREHAGGAGDDQRDHNDLPLWNLPHPNDAQALRNYEEEYEYDAVGNLTAHSHTAVGSSVGSWTRRYRYGDGPFTGSSVPVPANNRLHSTSLPGDPTSGPYTATYEHDANGNMVAMPHLAEIDYTHADQMKRADLGGGGTAYYTYDASGERVRKVIQRIGTTREERIYLGGWEIYRKRQGAGGDLVLERETLHVMDDTRRIAMVETKTVDADAPGTLTLVPRTRYQYSNHLDSAHLECDETGLVISYEEYHPYGTPAYRSARSGVEVSEKRYRYTGKERDEETGFQYHSARYYAPWLGRWTSADPLGMVDGPSLYVYARDNPVLLSDPGGTETPDPAAAQLGRALDTTGKCPITRTFASADEYAASAATEGTQNDDGTYTGTQWVPCARPATAPAPKPAPQPAKPATTQPAAKAPKTVSYDQLLQYSAEAMPKYRYDPSVHRVFGVAGLVGGGLELVGGVVAFGVPEPTLATKFAGGILFGHGADTIATNFQQIWTGEPTPTVMFRVSAGIGHTLDFTDENAALLGRINSQLFGMAAAGSGLVLASVPIKVGLPVLGAGEEGGAIVLATRSPSVRGPWGHSVIGADTAAGPEFVHQVGDGKPLIGGYLTEVVKKPDFTPNYSGLRLPVSLQAAVNAETQAGALMGPSNAYNLWTNSCVTTCLPVLRAAGLNPPWWARSPMTLAWWFRMQGAKPVALPARPTVE